MVALTLFFFVIGCEPIEKPDLTDNTLGGGDTGGNGVLFEETFEGNTLSALWLQNPDNATIEIDDAAGDPAPSLHIRTSPAATDNSAAFVTTASAFSTDNGLTITVGIHVDNPGRAGGNTDGVQVVLADQERFGLWRASMGVHRNRLGGVSVAYNIDPGGFPAVAASEDIAMPSEYHEFTIVISPDGSARWSRNGVEALSSRLEMVDTDVRVMLLVTGVGVASAPEQTAAHFDNVTITRP